MVLWQAMQPAGYSGLLEALAGGTAAGAPDPGDLSVVEVLAVLAVLDRIEIMSSSMFLLLLLYWQYKPAVNNSIVCYCIILDLNINLLQASGIILQFSVEK